MNIDITPTDGYPHMYDYLNNAVGVGSNPLVIIILTFVITYFIYHFMFFLVGWGGGMIVPLKGPGSKVQYFKPQ